MSLTFEAACERYNEKPSSKSALAVLRQEAGAQRVFRLTADGKINVAETSQALAVLRTFPTISIPDAKTFDEIQAAQVQTVTAEACPITGAAILFGKTATDPPIIYAGIDRETRLILATAADANEIFGIVPAADLLFNIAEAKALPKERRWAEASKRWQELATNEHRTDKQEADYRRIKARLVYAPERDTTRLLRPTHKTQAAESCAADGLFSCPGYRGKCARSGEVGICNRQIPKFNGGDELLGAPSRSSVTIGGSVHGGVISTGNNNTVTINTSQPTPLVGIYATGDRGKASAALLDQHMAPGRRSGLWRTWTPQSIPGGASMQVEIRRAAAEALVWVVLVNVDLLNDDFGLGLVAERRAAGKRVMPVEMTKIEDWQMNSTPFAGMQASPRAGSISSFARAEEGWNEVASELRVLVSHLMKTTI